jgi:hypothetical protein
MSQVTITVPGVGPITLNLPNGPLPTVDPLTGKTWLPQQSVVNGQPVQADPQPGTYGLEQTTL